ncbi:hypothetical protein D9M70_546120 [compost metagenome]
MGQRIGAGLGQFLAQDAFNVLVIRGFLLDVEPEGADLAVEDSEPVSGLLQIVPAQVEGDVQGLVDSVQVVGLRVSRAAASLQSCAVGGADEGRHHGEDAEEGVELLGGQFHGWLLMVSACWWCSWRSSGGFGVRRFGVRGGCAAGHSTT